VSDAPADGPFEGVRRVYTSSPERLPCPSNMALTTLASPLERPPNKHLFAWSCGIVERAAREDWPIDCQDREAMLGPQCGQTAQTVDVCVADAIARVACSAHAGRRLEQAEPDIDSGHVWKDAHLCSDPLANFYLSGTVWLPFSPVSPDLCIRISARVPPGTAHRALCGAPRLGTQASAGGDGGGQDGWMPEETAGG